MAVISSYCLVLTAKTVCLVWFYYVFSVSITFYNKWYSKNYRIPLMMTTVHFIVKFVIAWLMRAWCKCFRSSEVVFLPWSVYVYRVVPAAAATALDVAFSNWGMEYITVALYTMTKSTAIIFVLLFGMAFKLEKPKLSQILIIMLIAGGLFLFKFQSTDFNTMGFALVGLVLCASVIAGIRVTLAQILTQNEAIGLSNPVDLIYHLQPFMIIVTIAFSSQVEGTRFALSRQFFGAALPMDSAVPLLTMLCGAFLAFGLAFSEYLLLFHTSGLTFAVAAVFKEVIVMGADPFFEGTVYTTLNIVGIVICILGISTHAITKAMRVEADRSNQPSEIRKRWENKTVKQRRKLRNKNHPELMEMLNMNHSQDDDDEVVVFSSLHNRTRTS